MGALLVKRILWRVSQTLTDTKPQFKRYTERDMVMALQCGVKALCKYLPSAGARPIAMKLASGSRQSIAKIPAANIKTYDGGTPTDIYGIAVQELVRNMGANGTTPGKAIPPPSDRQRLDALDPDWHTRIGDVVTRWFYNPQDPTTFFVSPAIPSGSSVWVDVLLIAPPKVIQDGGEPGSERYSYEGTSNETVGVDDLYEDELWNYCVAYLLLSDAKSQQAMVRATLHAQAFTSSINSLVNSATGHNPNLKVLPFAPEVPGAAS